MSEAISIVAVDDHTLLRDVLCDALEAEPDLSVVAKAGSGEAAVKMAVELRPDVVILDVEMPGQDVVTTVKQLQDRRPDTHILILSMHDNPVIVQQLVGLGIGGYLHKSVSRATLISAIRAVREGGPSVIMAVSRRSMLVVPPEMGDVGLLSVREFQVLGYVASAMSNRQIASHLGITEGTVKRHMQNIFRKLNAVSRIDAVNKARSLTPMHKISGTGASRTPALSSRE